MESLPEEVLQRIHEFRPVHPCAAVNHSTLEVALENPRDATHFVKEHEHGLLGPPRPSVNALDGLTVLPVLFATA